MIIGTMIIEIRSGWVHSLKEKRMIVKSICAKCSNKFNISIAEIEKQDIHQTAVIGIACVTSETGHCHSILENVLNFIEDNTEGEVFLVERSII